MYVRSVCIMPAYLPSSFLPRPKLRVINSSKLYPRRKMFYVRACASSTLPSQDPPTTSSLILSPIAQRVTESLLHISIVALAITAAVLAKIRLLMFSVAFLTLPALFFALRNLYRAAFVRQNVQQPEQVQLSSGLFRNSAEERLDSLRMQIGAVEKRAVERERRHNETLAETFAALDAQVRAFKGTVEDVSNRENEASLAVLTELEVTKSKLKEVETEKRRLEGKLQVVQLSLEENKRQTERALKEVEQATTREVTVMEELQRMVIRAERGEEIRNKVERMERENEELKERVLRKTREIEELKMGKSEAEGRVSKVEEIAKSLRDRLMGADRGKEERDMEDRFWEQRLRKKASFGTGSLLYQELMGRGEREWPENVLGGGKQRQMENLPADGGFGAFGEGGEDGKIEGNKLLGGGEKVFSFSRDEFDEGKGGVKVSDKGKGKETAEEDKVYDSVVEGGSERDTGDGVRDELAPSVLIEDSAVVLEQQDSVGVKSASETSMDQKTAVQKSSRGDTAKGDARSEQHPLSSSAAISTQPVDSSDQATDPASDEEMIQHSAKLKESAKSKEGQELETATSGTDEAQETRDSSDSAQPVVQMADVGLETKQSVQKVGIDDTKEESVPVKDDAESITATNAAKLDEQSLETKESPSEVHKTAVETNEQAVSSQEKDLSASYQDKDPAIVTSELVSSANELVKKARTRGLAVAHAAVLFNKAISRLEQAFNYTSDRRFVEIQLGNALLAWAKVDLADPSAAERLNKALSLFTSDAENWLETADDSTIFNTGLCLCLIASTCRDGKAREYYGRACEIYDHLLERNDNSRIGLFNCGLAYISLGRLAVSEGVDAQECVKYFETAAVRFARSIELKPDDVKAQAYLDDCEREIARLGGS